MHGTILCTIPDLLLIAQCRWRVRLSQQRLARDTGLSITTVNGLATGKHQQVGVATLGTICGYFGCQVGELLRYCPPGMSLSPLPDTVVRRPTLPGTAHVAVPIQNHISTLVAAFTPGHIADSVGIAWNTADGLKGGDATRLDLPILARICAWRTCTLDALLTADLAALPR
jgi:putative transcriptional regulator